MIVKKVGSLLFLKLQLHKLLKLLSVPLILLSLFLPFSSWNINQAKQHYEFQEPSLRTKLFDVEERVSKVGHQIPYEQIFDGIKMAKIIGMLNHESLLLTVPQGNSQQLSIRIVYTTFLQQKHLSKNIAFLSYRDQQSLSRFLFSYYKKDQRGFSETNPHRGALGIVRAGLNIGLSKQGLLFHRTAPETMAFLKIYGSNGVHSDLDMFQSIKELLEALHIEWAPCEMLFTNRQINFLRKRFYSYFGYFMGKSFRKNMQLLPDHLICQFPHSLFDINRYQSLSHQSESYTQALETQALLMQYGKFQSSSVNFQLSDSAEATKSQIKISKFVYSFLKEFSFQEDHLHSSHTLYYPLNDREYLSLTGTIYAGLVVLVGGLSKVILELIENSQCLTLCSSSWTFIELGMAMAQWQLTGNFRVFLIYLCLKVFVCRIATMRRSEITSGEETQLLPIQYLAVKASMVLMCFYWSVFNFSLFHLTVLPTLLILTTNKTRIQTFWFISMASLLLAWTLKYFLEQTTPRVSDFSYALLHDMGFNSLLSVENLLNLYLCSSMELQIIALPLCFYLTIGDQRNKK